ncbi:MAG: alcohol dehydrogenase catalytic domain-containing protein, partial [Gammaproteobacteria bacterium]
MKAWILDELGGAFHLRDVDEPSPPPGGAVVRMRATPLLSYLGAYTRGELPTYAPADGPFTPGTNGIGLVEAVGTGVYHFAPGDRVAVNPLFAAHEAVADPAQILIGLTRISPDSEPLMADWPSGTLRELAAFPASCLVPVTGLDEEPDARL